MARTKKLPAGFTRRPDGRLQYRFFIDKARCCVYGHTIEECKEKELKKREQKKLEREEKEEEASRRKVGNWSVEEYLEKWLERRRQKVQPATVRTYRKLANRMYKQDISGIRFGDMKLSELETEHVYQMQQSLLRDGLKTRSVNDTLSLLNHALETAVNERSIEWNPARAVERLKRTEEPARDTIHRALTREEADTFLNAAKESWYYCLYVFLLHTGLRIGEASALSIGDVTSDSINVYKTVTRTEENYIIAEQTKTAAGRRKVPTRPEAWKAWNDQRQLNAIFNPKGITSICAPVFTLPKGGVIRPDRVNTDIRRICGKAGIEYFTCHAFRATFTSRCIADNMDVKLLMEILGHVDVQQTLGLYGHGEEEKRRSQVLAVNF